MPGEKCFNTFWRYKLSSSKRFKLGKTRHKQLPSIISIFYYDTTKLLQAGNYVVIISN